MSTLNWIVVASLILSSAGMIIAWRNLKSTIWMVRRRKLIEEIFSLIFALENSQAVRFRHSGVEYVVKPVETDTEG